ncbi:hypothetical protein AB0C59_09375 [Streptomyces sp. NPDC048664]|uniref:hypothetical protein n=1 Tax=Streptomyces sp. NPDC048664 TaxID=3154505 RepID=UPI003431476C
MTRTQVARRRARTALAAAGLTTALATALTGCGGSAGGGSDTPDTSASSGSSASAGDAGGGTGTAGSKAGKLEGSWLATSEGRYVALVITGKQAGLFSSDGTVCNGTAGDEAGMRMIHLDCRGGGGAGRKRGTGMVDSVNATSMKVTWQGGGGLGAETYRKAEGGQMPSGLPTAGLGS